MKSSTRIMKGPVNFLLVLFVALPSAHAPSIRVDCNRGGSINGALASLASAGNTRGLTILVTGHMQGKCFGLPLRSFVIAAGGADRHHRRMCGETGNSTDRSPLCDSYDVTLIRSFHH